jgi:predicted N-acyltransferase
VLSVVETKRSLNEIDTSTWNELVDDVSKDYDWLNILEHLNGGELHPNHLVLRKNGHVVAVCPFYLQFEDMHYTLEERLFGKYKPYFNHLGISLRPSLVSFAPIASSGGILCRERNEKEKSIKTFALHIDALAKDMRVDASAFLFLREENEHMMEALKREGYRQCFMGSTSVLDITWNSFGEYMDEIRKKSRKSHKQIKSDMTKGEKDGVAIECEEEISAGLSSELKKMVDCVYSKYNFGRGCNIHEDFFSTVKKNLRERIIICVARKEGKPIGFSLFLAGSDRWCACFVGHHAELTRNNGAYFNVLYHAPIRRAIECGVKSIDYGMGAYLTKIRRGCSLKPMYMMVKIHRTGYRLFATPYLRMLNRYYINKEQRMIASIYEEHKRLAANGFNAAAPG